MRASTIIFAFLVSFLVMGCFTLMDYYFKNNCVMTSQGEQIH